MRAETTFGETRKPVRQFPTTMDEIDRLQVHLKDPTPLLLLCDDWLALVVASLGGLQSGGLNTHKLGMTTKQRNVQAVPESHHKQ